MVGVKIDLFPGFAWRRIQITVKHLRWSFWENSLQFKVVKLFSQKTPS